jgi:hypothetical protein
LLLAMINGRYLAGGVFVFGEAVTAGEGLAAGLALPAGLVVVSLVEAGEAVAGVAAVGAFELVPGSHAAANRTADRARTSSAARLKRVVFVVVIGVASFH